ncbi:hypothetical protein [Arthrobacter globiformis]|uniref:Uncharacterized protein n=1 Tax=Arthrobacter globiformis TaxID=1665 RepID=A0A328HDU7_ARTGO|nr:hypothetical protein [Arthrobacter globiformis]RAM36796.1 hypothetical protein DBZ45_13265 [Arthrobacter globiformis]
MTSKETPVQKFMRRTGKLRAIFGPAQQGSVQGRVMVRQDAAQRQREEQLRQWTTVRNADGTSYLVSR